MKPKEMGKRVPGHPELRRQLFRPPSRPLSPCVLQHTPPVCVREQFCVEAPWLRECSRRDSSSVETSGDVGGRAQVPHTCTVARPTGPRLTVPDTRFEDLVPGVAIPWAGDWPVFMLLGCQAPVLKIIHHHFRKHDIIDLLN